MSRLDPQLPVRLYGLPACGIKRLADVWLKQGNFSIQMVDLADLPHGTASLGYNLLVIDSRSFVQLGRDEWLLSVLQSLLEQADAILLNFLEAASLEQQMAWKRYLQNHFDKPVLLSLNHAVPDRLLALVTAHQGSHLPRLMTAWQTMEFTLSRVNLEHLMMVLDNAKTALGMQLLRVKAVLNTMEYENLIALEGGPYRWDTYPASETDVRLWENRLKIQGFDLNQEWLQQMLDACRI